MPNIAVIYTSKYGTTKRYAQALAQALDAQLLAHSAVKPEQLAAYDLVVYGGGLYAGGIAGIDLVTKHPVKRLVVFTVGLADPRATDYSATLDKNLTAQQRSEIPVFHLRGGIDYKALGPIHRVMMGMMKTMIARKPPEQRAAEDGEFLATYGKAVDYTDVASIAPIVAYVRSI